MNGDEFVRMLETYGANPARWPAEQRESGLRYADTLGPPGWGVLGRERLLDALLDTVESPEVSPSLHSQIIATIPRADFSPVFKHPWWSGVSAIGIASAGVAAGMLLMSALLSPISLNTSLPGSPDGALSFRQDAFMIPAIAPEED